MLIKKQARCGHVVKFELTDEQIKASPGAAALVVATTLDHCEACAPPPDDSNRWYLTDEARRKLGG